MQSRAVIDSTCAAIGTTLLLFGQPAFADPEADVGVSADTSRPDQTAKMSLQIEPGIATAVSNPQSQRTDAGYGQTIKLLFGVSRYLAVGPSLGFTTLPAATTMP